jgi:hypothetical protein
MDDAGPAFVALQALILMKRLNLRPKRTVRCEKKKKPAAFF